MTRLTYEDMESVPLGPYTALQAMGASPVRAFVHSVFPEIAPAYLTNVLYLLEGNVRHSAILGYVGAGGIGLLLNEKVSWREYDKVGTILLLLFAVVYLMEHLSTWLTRLVQQERTLGRQGRRLLAGAAAPQATELAVPLIVGVLAALVVGCVCGAFNGALVAYLNIQPMVATLILWTAARAIGLLVCNNLIVYVRNDAFAMFGGYIGPVPTPLIIAAVCIAVVTIVLKKSALGLYIQSVGINKKASRIAGLNSQKIIFLCYVLCGLCAGIAGVVASSRITSADTNNIGLNFELDAILAVALGGNSLAGGKFNLAGSIIGAYTIQAITTTMYNLGVSSAVNPVFKAVIVIVIVAVQAPPVKAFFKKLSAKRQAEKEVKGAVGV